MAEGVEDFQCDLAAGVQVVVLVSCAEFLGALVSQEHLFVAWIVRKCLSACCLGTSWTLNLMPGSGVCMTGTGPQYMGIIFVMIVCLVAPWFRRNALNWIVDMASIGSTFAFLYTCLCAYKLFQWNHQKNQEHVEGSASSMRKVFAAAGVLVAIAFTLLLLVPGSPAQLSMPSFIAMGAWLIIGAVFYLSRYQHSKSITNNDVDQAVLGTTRPQWAK